MVSALWNRCYCFNLNRCETKLGWEEIKDSNMRGKQTQEGIKWGRMGLAREGAEGG